MGTVDQQSDPADHQHWRRQCSAYRTFICHAFAGNISVVAGRHRHFRCVVIGKHIYGGIGGNPFNPVLIGVAILMVAWKDYFDFNEVLMNYDLSFAMVYPLAAAKHLGTSGIDAFSTADLLIGPAIGWHRRNLWARPHSGWNLSDYQGFYPMGNFSIFFGRCFVTALLFHMSDPSQYAGPVFHLLTGYTLIGAFFLATDDSSSPVNFIPMLIYGAGAGVMTVLIRNIGSYVDGVVFAILLMNLINPICDKIRPKALGKVM